MSSVFVEITSSRRGSVFINGGKVQIQEIQAVADTLTLSVPVSGMRPGNTDASRSMKDRVTLVVLDPTLLSEKCTAESIIVKNARQIDVLLTDPAVRRHLRSSAPHVLAHWQKSINDILKAERAKPVVGWSRFVELIRRAML
jgi:hypothetical protein